MVLTYKQCIDRYGSDHMLKKEIAEGNVFQKEKGMTPSEYRATLK